MPNNNLPIRYSGTSLSRVDRRELREIQRGVARELAYIEAVEDVEIAKTHAIKSVAMHAMIDTTDLVSLGSILVERDPAAAGILDTEIKIAAHAMGNRLLDLNRKLG
jgi:hypothetical protein